LTNGPSQTHESLYVIYALFVCKIETLVHLGSAEAVRWLKSTYAEIQDGGRRSTWKWLNC